MGREPLQRPLNVLMWNADEAFTSAVVQLPHRFFLPTTPDRGPFGRGRDSHLPGNAVEIDTYDLCEIPLDVALIQRPDELHLLERWARLRPGRDISVVYRDREVELPEIPESHDEAESNDRKQALQQFLQQWNNSLVRAAATTTIDLTERVAAR